MFGLLNSSQIYGLQQEATSPTITKTTSSSNSSSSNHKQRRNSSNASETGKESKFFASLSSMQGSMKSPTNFIEKFIKTELLGGYDTIKNYKNFQHSSTTATSAPTTSSSGTKHNASGPPEGILTGFNCLHGSYRSNCESEFYEAVNVSKASAPLVDSSDMTIKCSKNLLAVAPAAQAPATLQNYQKLPECGEELLAVASTTTPSSGASSGEFNSDAGTGNSSTPTGAFSLYKKLSCGRGAKNLDVTQTIEVASDNSSSSISTTTTNSSANTNSTSNKSTDLQRTSSASSSSNDCATTRERKKSLGLLACNTPASTTPMSNASIQATSTLKTLTPERAQRRKLMQMISSYEQHNKLLQRELAKEKRRRTEELACVVKSLICFESKLKTDMKSVNQRLADRDVEICRLVRQNRALRKQLTKAHMAAEQESACDEGVVEDEAEAAELERDDNGDDDRNASDKALLLEDCLVLEALQCMNCRQQFYDIDLKEGLTQTVSKDGVRNNDDHTTEHGSSSDDTVSSSFYGARRSVRYTSKRTSGTFRDYMRSRSMNIDDPTLADQHNSEETTCSISRGDDSQTSYEKINIYSRTIERMHGVKCAEIERDGESELIGLELMHTRPGSRASLGPRKSNESRSSSKTSDISSTTKQITQIEEDDGIFSPTQDDDDFDEDMDALGSLKIVQRRSMEFSEASPKQIYETSTDDWYASASDQEENVRTTTASKCYRHGAINPVLECVNQILLQQSMEEPHDDCTANLLESSSGSAELVHTPKTPNQLLAMTANLPRRSSLSGRRSSRSNSHSSDGQNSRNGTLTRKRVHFSTKNSMVHVPRNDDHTDDDDQQDSEGVVKPLVSTEMISTSSSASSPPLTQYHSMNYLTQNVALNQNSQTSPSTTHVRPVTTTSSPADMPEHDRLDTLNYESIYSNEYEPIGGSEHNSSNLYVDMESTAKMAQIRLHSTKMPKMPPALPPKPANLLKFKKSLQQLDEMPDEHLSQDCCNASVISNAHSEPDYCSISEVNVVVQIVADIHKPPAESEADLETNDGEFGDLALEVSTVASDDTCAATHKTDEIEEIFADIPKLPNVAAIIAPKQPKYQSDYLVMSPKVKTPSLKLMNARKLNLNLSAEIEYTPKSSTKIDTTPLKLQLNGVGSSQYKRKHVPNILAEINKRISQPTTPTKLCVTTLTKITPPAKSSSLLKSLEENSPNLPLQAEFDWYNLDLEYGKTQLKVNEGHTGCSAMLAEIHEDHEGIVAAADEYNLDEEFSLVCETKSEIGNDDTESESESATKISASAAICEAINFPLYNVNSSKVLMHEGNNKTKAKKIKKNLANFEKFIEGSGLSTKPLPSKRKIYFAGPFV